MQATRTTHSDGTVFEREGSYARAVRIGSHVAVSGTAPIGPEGTLYPGDSYRQTYAAITKEPSTPPPRLERSEAT